jgi:hypothetical protein
MENSPKSKGYKLASLKHKLLHCSEYHARPVVFNKDKHNTYAAVLLYPVYITHDSKELRIATDFVVQLPFVYVTKSIPFDVTYPLTEVYIQ